MIYYIISVETESLEMSQKSLRFFSIAEQQAYLSQLNFQLGACLVSNGKVISSSYNQDRAIARLPVSIMQKTHQYDLPPSFLSDKGSFLCPSLHAEIATIVKAASYSKKKTARGKQPCLLRVSKETL